MNSQSYMLNKLYPLLLLSTMFCSCTGNKGQSVPETNLKGKPVVVDSAYYGSKALLLCGNLLFTLSQTQTETCCIGMLSKDSLAYYQGGFLRGHGHNEFQEVALAKGMDSCVYIAAFPSTNSQILSITKTEKAESINTVKDPGAWTKYDLASLPFFSCRFDVFNILSDSTMLVSGAPYEDIEHIMTIVNFRNPKLTPLDYWPEDTSPCEGLAKHSVYTDNCRILKGADDRFLYVCGEGNFAFIFSIEGTTVKVIKELYSLRPEYDYMGDDKIGRMNYTIRNRPARDFRVDANDSHIYVFLKEKDKDGNRAQKRRTSVCGNILEVYDWNGNLEKKIEVDHLGHNIKVTEDDRFLYLFSENPDTFKPEIWAYDLRD